MQQYPKAEKYALAADTKAAAYELLRLLVTANKRYHKKTTMQDADIQLDILRHLIRLGKDLGMMRQPGHRFFYGVDEVEPVIEDS